jgi:2-keto-3-deoxy-L-fuconate dehydrogenase
VPGHLANQTAFVTAAGQGIGRATALALAAAGARVIATDIDAAKVGRLGTPEEIAELAVYLASYAAQFITGQAIVIDGGLTL